MKGQKLFAILALILIVCTLFVSCGLFGGSSNQPDNENSGNSGNENGGNTGDVETPVDGECKHEKTTLTGAKDATCSAKGYTGDYVCDKCEKVVTPGSETPILDHEYDEGQVTKTATCVAEGVFTYTCTGCGNEKTETISITDHAYSYTDAQDGTHFVSCKNCDLDQQVAHTPRDDGEYYAASCTEAAYLKLVCTDCKASYKQYDESQPASNHAFGDWVITVAPTCVTKGEMTQRCTNEGCEEYNTLELPKATSCSMAFFEYDPMPDCQNPGKAIYKCTGCGKTEEKTLEATGVHNYEETGYVDGWIIKTCLGCGDVQSYLDASYEQEVSVDTETVNKDQSLEVNTESAAIQFPKDVVTQITDGASVSISAGVIDDTAKEEAIGKMTDVSEEEKNLILDAPVYDFTVTLDDKVFSENFSQPVAITVDYHEDVTDPDGIIVYYLAEDGTIQTITDVVYNEETKQITFFVEHFSYYAVAYKETQAMRCRRGLHDYEATDKKVQANCYTFGYTIYECTHCHESTLDDIVERLEHSFGDIIDANPTCDRGDYVTRVCQNEGCGHVINVTFVGATGHKVNAPASCTTAAICTKCDSVVHRALGHTWSDWKIIIPATAFIDGLRTRICVTCQKVDQVRIVATGTVEPIEFETYEELIGVLVNDVLGMPNGNINVSLNTPMLTGEIDLAVEETENGYRLGFNFDLEDSEGNGVGFVLYYEDGRFYMAPDGEFGVSSDLNELIPIDAKKVVEVLDPIYAEFDNQVAEYITQLRTVVDIIDNMYGEVADDLLSELKLGYTVYQLHDLIDTIESVYVYFTLRLGFTTQLSLLDEVILPSSEDIQKVLAEFMEVTEADGETTYNLSVQKLVDLANKLIDFLDERKDMSLASFVYDLIGKALAESNEDIVDFESIMDLVKKEFPGTLKVSDAVDKYIDFAAANALPSIETMFKVADAILLNVGGEKINTKELVLENSDTTINQLIRAMTGAEDADIKDLYIQLEKAAYQITVGELSYGELTLSALLEAGRMILDGVDVNGGITFVFDEYGRLAGLDIGGELWMHEEFNPEADSAELGSISITLTHGGVTVVIPEGVKEILVDVNHSYDNDGNLVIEGLSPDLDFDFSANGGASIDLEDYLVLDEEKSEEYGIDVYVLPEKYWNATEWLNEYFMVDGKYYIREGKYAEIIEAIEHMTLEDFIYSGNAFYVDEEYYLGNLVDTNYAVYPVKSNYANTNYYDYYYGIAYMVDGSWMVSSQYGQTDSGEYYVTDVCSFDEFSYNLTLASTSGFTRWWETREYKISIDGVEYDALNLNLSIGNSGKTAAFAGFLADGQYYVLTDYDFNGRYLYTLGEALDELPEHDIIDIYYTTVYVQNEDGSIEEREFEVAWLQKLVPTYYVKVSDGVYTNVYNHYIESNINTSGKDTLLLPDGNTLYIEGTTSDNDYGYIYGYETVYGYVAITPSHFQQTIAFLNGDEIVEYHYRNAVSEGSVRLDYIYNINDYLTVSADGKYVISAELINAYKDLAGESGNIYVEFVADTTIGDQEVKYYYSIPIVSNPVEGVSYDTMYEIWEQLFGYGGGSGIVDNNYYTPSVDENGDLNLEINDNYNFHSFSHNALYADVEDGLVYNEKQSEWTGFDIYSYNYMAESWYSDIYVYMDGKYYNYGYHSNHNIETTDTLDLLDGYRIEQLYYCYDMVGDGELDDGISVYVASIRFGMRAPSMYKYPTIDAYVFFLDGQMQICVGAETTGESLLQFESYMPLNEYLASLVYEVDYASAESYDYCYVDGVSTCFYHVPVKIYETDGQGNKLNADSYKTVYVSYVVEDGEIKFVTDYSYLNNDVFTLNYETDISHIPADAKRVDHTETINGVEYSFAEFSWTEEYERSINFIKLADRYYRYNGYYTSNIFSCFEDNRLSEESFMYEALSKVWYYRVFDESLGEDVYYTEFTLDGGNIIPSGDIVDYYSINGDYYGDTHLGYTPDGQPVYEVVYYTYEISDISAYTAEEQSDGTIFYHRNGAGYLCVKDANDYNWYVRARKVTALDGSSYIMCILADTHIDENAVVSDSIIDKYIKVNGNTVTISKEFLEVAGYNKNDFRLGFELEDADSEGITNYFSLNYYTLETLFML